MSRFIDMCNHQEIRRMLQHLKPDAIPAWGTMKPQQMVEHLIDQVQYTNGTKIPTSDVSAEQADLNKAEFLHPDYIIPKGAVLGSLPDIYLYPDLQTAISRLMTELNTFDKHFETPGRIEIHGGCGPLNYQQWLIWHGKHFTHHFTQFGLIN